MAGGNARLAARGRPAVREMRRRLRRAGGDGGVAAGQRGLRRQCGNGGAAVPTVATLPFRPRPRAPPVARLARPTRVLSSKLPVLAARVGPPAPAARSRPVPAIHHRRRPRPAARAAPLGGIQGDSAVAGGAASASSDATSERLWEVSSVATANGGAGGRAPAMAARPTAGPVVLGLSSSAVSVGSGDAVSSALAVAGSGGGSNVVSATARSRRRCGRDERSDHRDGPGAATSSAKRAAAWAANAGGAGGGADASSKARSGGSGQVTSSATASGGAAGAVGSSVGVWRRRQRRQRCGKRIGRRDIIRESWRRGRGSLWLLRRRRNDQAPTPAPVAQRRAAGRRSPRRSRQAALAEPALPGAWRRECNVERRDRKRRVGSSAIDRRRIERTGAVDREDQSCLRQGPVVGRRADRRRHRDDQCDRAGRGSGQAFVNPGQTAYAFSTALPDKAYATTLIGGASHVASALLGPRDAVFGTAILGANYAPDGGGESTHL